MKGVWNDYVDKHLLPRIHGFEVLMASYAMAHLKLNMIHKETVYQFNNPEQRLGVYLTNSLEDINFQPKFNIGWINRKLEKANEIKKNMPLMVVIGNPPYSGKFK
ncbi:MAG: hypothetical protein LBS81_00380 [Endomicrobium sp.]|jgi:predicted helicase|nr:hypothetical protein [Endomicrobium sp.]